MAFQWRPTHQAYPLMHAHDLHGKNSHFIRQNNICDFVSQRNIDVVLTETKFTKLCSSLHGRPKMGKSQYSKCWLNNDLSKLHSCDLLDGPHNYRSKTSCMSGLILFCVNKINTTRLDTTQLSYKQWNGYKKKKKKKGQSDNCTVIILLRETKTSLALLWQV